MVVVLAISVMQPTYRPDPPKPVMARPRIITFIDGAAPQMAEPISKIATWKM